MTGESLYCMHHHNASSLARQYKFLPILSATFPSSQGSFASKLGVSSLRMFGTCSTTASAVHDDSPRRPWTKPRSYLDESWDIPSWPQRPRAPQKLYLKQLGLHQTPESVRCHHFVTCSGHPSKCWPRSPMLNLRDQQRHSTASPEKLAYWQGSVSSLLYCPPQKYWISGVLNISCRGMYASYSVHHRHTCITKLCLSLSVSLSLFGGRTKEGVATPLSTSLDPPVQFCIWSR
jgi:hypothetical protein